MNHELKAPKGCFLQALKVPKSPEVSPTIRTPASAGSVEACRHRGRSGSLRSIRGFEADSLVQQLHLCKVVEIGL